MDDKKLTELEQQRMRERSIIEENENANKMNIPSAYTTEQVELAQENTAGQKINELYYSKIFPWTNAIVYVIYCAISIIVLPFVYKGYIMLPALFSFVGLFGAASVLRIIEKKNRSNMNYEKKWIKKLMKFSDQSSIFSYCLTSIGYLLALIDTLAFWFLYISLVVIVILCFIDCMRKPREKSF